MSAILLDIHPKDPQPRLLKQAAAIVEAGGVIIYPTDSAYALGCRLDDKKAALRIRDLRKLPPKHNFTLVCRDMSELSSYANVDNTTFRFLKAHTPGPFTFVLTATKEVPRRLVQEKRKTIGLRVPEHPVALSLLEQLGTAMMSVTLIMPGDDLPLSDPDEIVERMSNQVDLIITSGNCGIEPTTIVDLVGGEPTVLRQGKGQLLT